MRKLFFIIFILCFVNRSYNYQNSYLFDLSITFINNNFYEKILIGYENFYNNSQVININIGFNNIYTNFGINFEFDGKYFLETNQVNSPYVKSGIGITIHYIKNNLLDITRNNLNIPDKILPYFVLGIGYRYYIQYIFLKNIFLDFELKTHLIIGLINNLDNDISLGIKIGYYID